MAYVIDRNLLPTAPAVEVKDDPFTLGSLISWLETKDPSKEYCWMSGGCLYGQYGLHLGLGNGRDSAAYLAVCDGFGAKGGAGPRIEPFGSLAMSTPRTFGAALTRARAYAAGEK